MKKTNRPTLWALLVLGGAATAGLALTSGHHVEAADHLDPPARTNPAAPPDGAGAAADREADIADVYAWHTGSGSTGRVTTVLSFAGPNMPAADQAIPCDPDVLYNILISNDDDLTPEFTIDVRFAADDLGNCFARFSGAPGMAMGSSMVVPVETPTTRGEVDVFAGLRDDAFFFDLEGFRTTLSTGTLSMTNDRDFFAGKNTSAIVVEFPLLAVSPAGETFRVWGTTARIGG